MASVLIVIKHVIATNIVRIPDNQYKIQALFWREKRREFGAKNAANWSRLDLLEVKRE